MDAPVPPPLPEYLGFLTPYGQAITDLALATRAFVLERAPGVSVADIRANTEAELVVSENIPEMKIQAAGK